MLLLWFGQELPQLTAACRHTTSTGAGAEEEEDSCYVEGGKNSLEET